MLPLERGDTVELPVDAITSDAEKAASEATDAGLQLLDGKRKLVYARLEEVLHLTFPGNDPQENLGFSEAEQLYVEAVSFLKGYDRVRSCPVQCQLWLGEMEMAGVSLRVCIRCQGAHPPCSAGFDIWRPMRCKP
eukprot:2927102-Rhodomonas_salina.1